MHLRSLSLARAARRALALVLVASAGSATAALARQAGPELAPRPALVKPERASLFPFERRDAIAVKFQDGLALAVRGGRLVEDEPVLGPAARVQVERAGAGQWVAISPLEREAHRELLRRAEAGLGRRIADLSVDFVLLLGPGEDALAAIDAFNALEEVELARGVALPPPEPARVTNARAALLAPPDFSAGQGYLTPAPEGIDAGFAWHALGARGAGVRLADVEYDFNEHHADLPAVTVLGATPISPFGNDHHGTACLGEAVARHDGVGTSGIAPDAHAHFAATYTQGFVNVAGAVLRCVSAFGAGDVILIEAQVWGPLADPFSGSQFGMVPVEWQIAEYSAIQMAVGLGITVVEAGANGSQDLDDPLYSTANGGHWPFLPENDSGAIVVGAGHAPAAYGGTDVDRSRRWYSSHGSRVDLQGWGQAIWTSGYGDAYALEGPNALYTSIFSGTSGASPIVAGACVLLQSAQRAHAGTPLAPGALRALLRSTGSPQQSGEFPASEEIGPRPDVRAAALALGLSAFTPVAGCAGNPLALGANGQVAELGAPLALSVTGAPAGAGVAWLFGGLDGTAPASCGVVLPGVGEVLLGFAPGPWLLGETVSASGAFGFVLPLPPDPALAGVELRFQSAHLGAAGSLALSNGLSVRPSP